MFNVLRDLTPLKLSTRLSKRFSSLKKNAAINETPLSPSDINDINMKLGAASPFNE